MPAAIRETIQVLELIVQGVPIGTNLGLLYMLWALLNGSFLSSRGAIFPALQRSGFDAESSRRSWAALRYGAWTIEQLLEGWRGHVLAEGKWQRRSYEGYRPLVVDWTAFWRPQLKNWQGRFFHRLANRGLCGVGFGVIVEVGDVDKQRLPLLRRILRIEGGERSERRLKKETLLWVGQELAADEIAIMDAGVQVSECQGAGIQRFVVRLGLNRTGRRNFLPAPKERGRPREKGELVRPLSRSYKGRTIVASKPDEQNSFVWQGREIEVQGWHDLILSDLRPDPNHNTFTIWVFSDPAYQDPLMLATNVPLRPQSMFALYLDRWSVEQAPLAAKQMLGLHRQFVFAPQSCHRLPELALLAGNILSYLAAVLPPMPTGFWDRHPKKLQAVCAESWPKPIFSLSMKNMADFAKRTRSHGTYPRALTAIAAKNGILSPFSSPTLSLC